MTLGERMIKLETRMEEHCKSNDDRFDNLEKRLQGIENGISDLPDKLSNKFASKLTEKVVYGLIGIILSSFAVLVLIKVGWK